MRLPPESRQFTRRVRLRPARPGDAAFVFALRSDSSRNAFLSRVGATLEAQRRWLEEYVAREAAGEEYYFIVESIEGEDLGAGRVYHIGDDDFEWGSWIMKPGAPPQAAIESALSVYAFGFGPLGKTSAHFKVRHGNERVVEFHRRFGAEEVGDDGLAVQFRLTADDFHSGARKRFARFLL